MKAKGTHSLLGIAALAGAMAGSTRLALPISAVNQRHSYASPPSNQRRKRKAARRAWAAGDRAGFTAKN